MLMRDQTIIECFGHNSNESQEDAKLSELRRYYFAKRHKGMRYKIIQSVLPTSQEQYFRALYGYALHNDYSYIDLPVSGIKIIQSVKDEQAQGSGIEVGVTMIDGTRYAGRNGCLSFVEFDNDYVELENPMLLFFNSKGYLSNYVPEQIKTLMHILNVHSLSTYRVKI